MEKVKPASILTLSFRSNPTFKSSQAQTQNVAKLQRLSFLPLATRTRKTVNSDLDGQSQRGRHWSAYPGHL
ncbi:hypothetical protein CEXT_661301 [Caerostris extrusa]|uniref:Uncharacterized protein n=1 Tax=Caerostris extrusa TaxID=172846 RepID=A0AAV4W537_CAEEX|nr:hypothetical protein CEXT_661301 [Caerostris extrusa]